MMGEPALGTRFKKKLAVALAAIIVLGASVDFIVQTHQAEHILQNQTTEVSMRMAPIRARIEGTLFANLLLINGMAAYISVNPDLTADQFTAMARQLMAQPNLLRNIAAAPDFIMTFVWPLEGNRAILGKNYRDLPGQWEQAKLARDTGHMVIAGPLKLVQGGQGIIGRVPVFYGEGDHRRFWGLVSSLIDLDKLIEQAGLNSLGGDLDLALRSRTGGKWATEAFHGRTDLFDPQAGAVLMEIKIHSGVWQMAGRPEVGNLNLPTPG